MITILLVEDSQMNRDLLRRRLERQGYRVLEAEDGHQALATAQRQRPALILMDLNLPGLDGWEAARCLKHNPDTAPIPIIALTAHAMSADRDKALSAGCDDYDTKPIVFSRLLEKIQAWLNNVQT